MSTHEDECGVWLDETTWRELCARARLRCRICKKIPPVEDVDFLIENGTCVHCAAVLDRMMRD
jgi:hypothetical protein